MATKKPTPKPTKKRRRGEPVVIPYHLMAKLKLDTAYENNIHPRVLWGADELDGLKARFRHPRMDPPLRDALARCAAYCDPGNAAFIDTTVSRTLLIGAGADCGHLWRKLADLILAAIMTGDKRWSGFLASILRVIALDQGPIAATIFPGNDGHHGCVPGLHKTIVSQCGMIPLAYDAIYNELAAEDRAAVASFLRAEIVEPFLAYLFPGTNMPRLSLGINIFWWDFYACLWSLAAIYDPADARHREAAELCADLVRRGLHMGVDETGIIGEGPFYGSIETFDWLTAAEILRRMGICDLWATETRLHKLMKARVYYLLPGLAGILDHGDAPRTGGMYSSDLMVMLLHGQRTGDPVMQQTWDRLAHADPAAQSFLGPLGVLGLWLWYDPAQAPVPQAPPDWPLALGGGLWGVNLLRSGWGADDLFFALYAAGRDPGTFIHQQVDAGHFALAALGEVFCTGRGYGHTAAAYQNVLRVGGREPADSPDKVGQMWRGGHMRTFAPGRISDYVSVDIAWQWQSCWYLRHALVVRFPGAEPYVVLLDNCNQANDWLTYDWTFQVEPGHRAELAPPGLRATVHGKTHRLELAWAHFGAADYPRAHRLELLTDRVESPYQGEKSWQGDGAYDRLVARLHGFNGVLLTALLPRRAGTGAVGIERFAGRYEFGMRIEHGGVTDTIVAAPIDRRITTGGIDAEATLICVRKSKSGQVLYACAADAFMLAVDGRALLPRQGEPRALFEHAEALF